MGENGVLLRKIEEITYGNVTYALPPTDFQQRNKTPGDETEP